MRKTFTLAYSIWVLGIGVAAAQESIRGRTANPHGDLKIACENCHATTAWKPIRRQPEFDHNRQTSFALQGLHKDVPCQSCHVSLIFSDAPTRCAECHADLHRRQFGPDCEKCHTVRGWDVAISAIQQHNNRFPLLGAHSAATCDQCHFGAATGVYTGLSTQCVSCHIKDYQRAKPNHVTAKLSTTCENCHGINTWLGARFDHAQVTGFALVGAHASVAMECTQCHINNNFALTSTACIDCHLADFNTTTNPPHRADGYPVDCSICHGTAQLDWTSISSFNHSSTGFALTGAHTTVQCAQCHSNNNYGLTSAACVNCHLTDFNNTNNPPHKAAGFPLDCSGCHTTNNWNGATFNHATTGFTLVGVHSTQQCAACHVNNNFSLTSAACINCHATDFNNTTNPPHKAAGFPADCTVCHGTSITNWTSATFDHSPTGFALVGAHATQQCAACHINNNFNLTSGACINCHLTDFNSATNPPHQSSGFPQDCTLCHGTSIVNWTSAASFNHATTGFALTGAHTNLQCAQCHANNNFSFTSGACLNCHLADFNSTTNPPHKAANFPQDCSGCHTTVNWSGATFNHGATGFSLVGVHATQQCAACHVNNNFSLTSGACINCHLTDFNNANNPPHRSAGFPQDCTVCHGAAIVNWTSATFDHATTGFALVGVHAAQQCATCHLSGNFNLTSAACITCHLTDFNGANNPPHKAAGFPQDCTICHGSAIVNWTSATFNHATTGFALTGAHTNLQCAQCHTNGNFSIANGACVNCHLADYNSTNNPPHKSANFPQDCSGCHTTVNWDGATFNHATTGFALVGVHATQQCAACHVNNNFSLTSGACINCHLADFNNTSNPPHKAAGFPQDCTQCHGNSITDWTTGKFDHSTTGFTLAGAHLQIQMQCNLCHVNNNYSLTSAACWNCHQAEYNGAMNPPHKASNFPQDCTICHGTAPNDWTTGTFNHSSTGFALAGAHMNLQCNACHGTGTFINLTSAACWNCHQGDYNKTTYPPHQQFSNLFSQDCTGCHGTAPNDWTTGTFNNHTATGFPLSGAHSTKATCQNCHGTPPTFTIQTSTACVNCHLADYNQTNFPPHQKVGFSQDCSLCHDTILWTDGKFDHSTTGFTLTGAHTTKATCTSCHGTAAFVTLTSAACSNCHQGPTSNPDHTGLPKDCSLCHNTSDFSQTTFVHPTSPLQLTGYHLTTLYNNNRCDDCHHSNYTSTPADCWSCHQTDYTGTSNPPHSLVGFAHTCNDCHTFVDWTGARYTAHDANYFPIYSGAHNGYLSNPPCNDCHAGYTGTATIVCTNCHTTGPLAPHAHGDQTGVTADHQGVKGFAYTPPNVCLNCHAMSVVP